MTELWFFYSIKYTYLLCTYNQFHNTLRLFDVLPSETMVVITYKHGMYELPHELPHEFKI